MKSSKMLNKLLLLLFAVSLQAAPAPLEPPTLDEAFRGVAFTALVKGSQPMTYQWWRGTEKTAKVTKIPAPAGIQQTLHLEPPYVSGWYVCEISNAAGMITSKRFKLTQTKTLSAADITATVKVP